MFYFLQYIKMVLNFPATVKESTLLSVEDLVTEVTNSTLVEACAPNWLFKLSEDGNLLIFEWDSQKAAVKIDSLSEDELKLWILRLMPKETEEEREERLRWEQENELRAASLEEMVTDEMDFESYAY